MNADTWDEARDHEYQRERNERAPDIGPSRAEDIGSLWGVVATLRRVRSSTRIRAAMVELDEAIEAAHAAIRVLSEAEG